MRAVAPDVVSNDLPRDGRVVVILFDQTIRAAQQPAARRAAAAAVEALGPADVAAVMHVINGVGQNITRDRRRLLDAINATSMGLADTEAALAAIGQPPLSRGACPEDRCTFEVITEIAESLRDVPRRKILIFISPRIVLQSPGSGQIKYLREKMFRALDVANVALFAVDPSGLETLALDASVAGYHHGIARPSWSALVRQGFLQALAERNGGRALINVNEPETMVGEIYAESRSYYTLAFQSGSTSADGRFHSIDVRLNRRDATVHARKGHYTPRPDGPECGAVKAGPPRDLANAIERAWPATDLRLGLAAAAFADPSGDRPFAAITVRSMAGGPRVAALTAAFRQDGSAANSYWQALDLESVLQGVGPHAYDLLSRLPLEPGRYEIRAAVRDERGGKLGTVVTYLNVPDFAREPLSLSGVAFGVVLAPPAEPSAVFERTLPVVPSAQRTFSTSDRVRAFLRLYQGRGTLDPVALSVTIDDARERVVHEWRELLPITAFGTDRAAAYSLDLPLESLAPGAYRLRVAATRVQLQVSQDVRFAVE